MQEPQQHYRNQYQCHIQIYENPVLQSDLDHQSIKINRYK